jgi:acyl-CoA hydrolase
MRPDIQLLLGWCFSPPKGIEQSRPGQFMTLVSGFGLRGPIDHGAVGFIPVRLGSVPGLMRTVLRPDVVVASVRASSKGYCFTTEVSWMRAAVAAGATVAAVVRSRSPDIDTGEPIAPDSLIVLDESVEHPLDFPSPEPSDIQRAVAERVVSLIGPGVRVQVGPGGLGEAFFAALQTPIAVDTGLVTDPVVDLDERGLLLDRPLAPYLAGTERLRDWAPGRVAIAGIETTHDPCRLLNGRPLVAVNTCLQLDLDGQANAETVNGSWVGGIGGQPDYAAAAACAGDGLSIMALPSQTRGHPTLVRVLDGPVTTPGHDIDIVVTERGQADLRGLDRFGRRAALAKLWGSDAP